MLTPATWAQLLPRNEEMMHSAVFSHAVCKMSAITIKLVDFHKFCHERTTATVFCYSSNIIKRLTSTVLEN